jgi:hypothetical protein
MTITPAHGPRSLAIIALLAGCGGSEQPPPPQAGQVSVRIDLSRCKPACGVARVEFYVGEGQPPAATCLHASREIAPPRGSHSLDGVPVRSGRQVTLAAVAYCPGESCMRCVVIDTLTVSHQAAITLAPEQQAGCLEIPNELRDSLTSCP